MNFKEMIVYGLVIFGFITFATIAIVLFINWEIHWIDARGLWVTATSAALGLYLAEKWDVEL